MNPLHALELLLVVLRLSWASDFPPPYRNFYNYTYTLRILSRPDTPPASTSSFQYMGGRLLVHPITVNFLWIGNWTKRAKRTLRSAFLSLNDDTYGVNFTDYPTLSSWWKIATQYKDSSGRAVSSHVSLGSECSLQLMDLQVSEMLGTFAQAFNRSAPIQKNCTRVFHADESAIYHVLISKRVAFQVPNEAIFTWAGLLRNCAGRANLFEVDASGAKISLAWARVPLHKEYCNFLTRYGKIFRPPNGKSGGMDSLVSNVLALTADMATNWDFKGWVASSKLPTSIAHQCPSPTGWEDSTMPVIHDGNKNMSWNAYGRNGSQFLVQQLWDQGERNCALKPLRTCYGRKSMNAARKVIKVGLVLASTQGEKVGLQPLNANLDCEWTVKVRKAAHIRVHLHYLALGPDDALEVSYDCRSGECEKIVLRGHSSGKKLVDAAGASFHIRFVSGSSFSPNRMGWMLSYKAAFCRSMTDIRRLKGSLSDGSPEGVKYIKGSTCSWLFHARNDSKVRLEFTRMDTVSDMDVIQVYQGGIVVARYSGRSQLQTDVFIGPIKLVFTTQTGDGLGWDLQYVMDALDEADLSYGVKHAAANVVAGAICGVLIPGFFFIGVAILRCNSSLPGFGKRRKLQGIEKKPEVFSLDELRKATGNFSVANVVLGSKGNVFRGVMENGLVVAIKCKTSESELEILRRVRCTTIVNLLGFSSDAEDKHLVIDYMHLGSLARRLTDGTLPPVSWGNRLRIALQMSRALEYLHTYAEPFVVHLNVSAENVFLDGSWNAKLGEFSRARTGGNTKPALKLQDVCSFGSLLLELVTGKSASNRGQRRKALAAIEAGEGYSILDRRLDNESRSATIVVKMGEIAAWCIGDRTRQPSMVEVASTLSQLTTMFVNSASS